MTLSDIAIFFEPLPADFTVACAEGTLGEKVSAYTENAHFPEIEKGSVVLLGVVETRRSIAGEFNSDSLVSVRNRLYALKDHFVGLSLVDLGNINQGETVEDTYYALSSSIASIVKQGGVAVILGGGQDLTYANYLAYEKLEQVVNLVNVDSMFDIGDVEDAMKENRFMQKIILHQPNVLFNFSCLAYQTHHVLPREVDLMKKMYFDIYRLGEVQSNLEEVEPIVRNADMVSFDLTSIRISDYAVNQRSEPNGLYGEQACAISRYAGLSDKLSSIGFYNCLNAGENESSAHLIAQLVWYFLWGVNNRKQDYPFADKSEYTKYTVTLENGRYDVIFYKSQRSDRWWMEVPYPSKLGAKYERHFMVPCGYQDYLRACEDEIPDRWWQTFQKLS